MTNNQEDIDEVRSVLEEAIALTRAEVDSQEYDLKVMRRLLENRLQALEESERKIWDVFNKVGKDMEAVEARLVDLDERLSRIEDI
jgi:tRNA A-37 threonylcarbamoyl transferase component Bud32